MFSSRLGVFLLLTTLTLFSFVSAVQQSLAGVIDWHKPLIGIPRHDLSPLAWREGGKEKWVVGTRSNVLAVLDGGKGEIDWRIQLGEEDWIQSYSLQPEGILIVSGTSQPTLRLLSSSTGHLIWETLLPTSNSISQQPTPKVTVRRLEDGDVVGIQDGLKVFRVGGKDGVMKWEWDSSSVGLNGQLINLASSGSSIHVFASINGFSGHQLGHLKLSSDGTPSSSLVTTLDNISSPDDFVLTSNATTNSMTVSYLFSGVVKTVSFSADGPVGKPTLVKRDKKVSGSGKTPVALKELGLGNKGYFLVVNEDDSADIVSTKEGGEVIWHFDNEARNQRSKAIWNGFVNEQGHAFVSRLFWAHGMGLANLHIYNINHPDGYVYTGKTFAFDDSEHGVIMDSAITITSSQPIIDTFSLLLTTSTGSIQGWKEQSNIWTREEALAEVKEVRMVELPERKAEGGRVVFEDEGVVGRLIRHVGELKSLPSFITSFIARFASGTYTKSLSSTPLKSGSIYRDQFGFQKLAILATSTGKVFAIDSAHGNVVWTTLLGLSDGESGLDVKGMWSVRGVDTLEDAVVAIVAVRKTVESTITVAYHLDAFTGAIIEPSPSTPHPKDGKVLFDGEPLKTFPLPITHCKTSIRAVAVADPSGSIHLFPLCKKIESAFRNMSSDIFYNTVSDSSVRGHGITARSIDGTFPGYDTYLTPLESDHIISSIARPSTGPVASYGRVLGDRSTLYKYLNPHLVALSTRHRTEPLGSVYVVDSTTGRIVFRTTIEGVKGDIQVAMAENWVVYSYSEVGDVAEGKGGNRLVSMEMFEVGKSGSLETSTFSQAQEIQVISKTFIPPVGIKALSMTTSLQGITSKDLIMIDDRSRLLSIPRRLLDPRRPVGTLSKMDKEEMLVPYEVMLPFDPRRVISHEVELLGINEIHTSPALLESTSLILATGLDIFSTRANPSGTFDILSDAFNKVQLVLTIAGLAVGIMVARPAVQRKVLKGRWY